jgi:GNAT superfamily N-acetyltransferase
MFFRNIKRELLVLFFHMKIRRAQKEDAEIITEQNIALAKESENIILNHETTLAGVTALLSDEKKGWYLVAEEKRNIVGQLMITMEWSDWRNKPIWWVQSVYIQKPWRKQGVFTQLLDAAKKMAHQQGVPFLRLYAHHHNTPALKAYERSGWQQDPYVVYHLDL